MAKKRKPKARVAAKIAEAPEGKPKQGTRLLPLLVIFVLLALSVSLFFFRPGGGTATACPCPANASNPKVLMYFPDCKGAWAEQVSSPADLELGLSGRSSLCEKCGMLFVFKDSAPRAFWMKDMNFPLDMIFMDENRKVVKISANVPPCSGQCQVFYSSGLPAKYVLELNAGEAAKHNITEGAALGFSATDKG